MVENAGAILTVETNSLKTNIPNIKIRPFSVKNTSSLNNYLNIQNSKNCITNGIHSNRNDCLTTGSPQSSKNHINYTRIFGKLENNTHILEHHILKQ